MKIRYFSRFLIALPLLLISSFAAATMQYDFTGVITTSYRTYYGTEDQLFDGIQVGTIFTGRFSYNPELESYYQEYGWGSSIGFTVNDKQYGLQSFTNADLRINQIPSGNNSGDISYLYFDEYAYYDFSFEETVGIKLGDALSGSALTGSEFPQVLPYGLLLSGGSVFFSGLGSAAFGETWGFTGDLTSITPVPVPAAVWLFSLALSGLAFRFKKIKTV